MKRTNVPRSARFLDRRIIPLEHTHGRHVLHIGIGGAADNDELATRFRASDLRGSLHGRLSRVAKSLTGLDVNTETIEAMQAKVPGRYILADIADADLCDVVGTRFDLILFLEVIQDVSNPGQALANIKKMLNHDGKLILSTCNAYCLGRFAKMFFRYESVSIEHTCYFSYMTLKRLLHVTGFDIEHAHYTFMPRGKNERLAGKIFFLLEKAICRIWPQFGEGILVIARPRR